MSLTEAQIVERRSSIGGSDLPAILGISRRGPLDVYLAKKGLATSEESEPAYWGSVLEPVIVKELAKRTSLPIEHNPEGTLVRRPDAPWAHATPDGMVLGQPIGAEGKNRIIYKAEEWGPSGTDEVPYDVQAQCQWGMWVTGARQWAVGVLLGGMEFRYYILERDEVVIEAMVARAYAFWHENVVANVPPPMDASEGAKQFLKKMYPTAVNETMKQADEEIAHTLDALRHARIERDAAEERVESLENTVKFYIGECKGVVDPVSGSKASWSTTKPKAKVDYELAALEMGKLLPAGKAEEILAAAQVTPAPYRRFLFTFKKD